MSATSAPRYFTHVKIDNASAGPDGGIAADRQAADPRPAEPDEQWLDTGAPTDVDEGAADVREDAAFGPEAKGGPLPPPETAARWLGPGRTDATSSVSAEAQQGDGPAAASASASAVGQTPRTMAVSVVVGPHGAAAAGPFGVVVVGPDGVAAASQVGVAAVGPHGAASASNAANSTRAVVDDHGARPEAERD